MTQENKDANMSETNDWADMINIQDSEDIFTHKESFFQTSGHQRQQAGNICQHGAFGLPQTDTRPAEKNALDRGRIRPNAPVTAHGSLL